MKRSPAGYYILWISKNVKNTGYEIRDIKCFAFFLKDCFNLFLILHNEMVNVYNTFGEV